MATAAASSAVASTASEEGAMAAFNPWVWLTSAVLWAIILTPVFFI